MSLATSIEGEDQQLTEVDQKIPHIYEKYIRYKISNIFITHDQKQLSTKCPLEKHTKMKPLFN